MPTLNTGKKIEHLVYGWCCLPAREDRERILSEPHFVEKRTEADWEAEQVVGLRATLYETPAHILSRERLGTPTRTNYQAQLAHTGLATLANYARGAVMNKDKSLGAAIVDRLDTMGPAERRQVGVSR